MTKPKSGIGSRSAETRDRLIDAAITCLAQLGYSSATMRRIADTAGVTQGPRQYYFPTPASLFSAVVDNIHSSADRFVEETVQASVSGSIEDRIRTLADRAFYNCGNVKHLAMIELKLACRGNPALRETLETKIIEYENRNDLVWIKLLEESGLTEAELRRIRAIFAATVRGLGVAIAAGADRGERQQIGEALIQMTLARISTAQA